jgi:predicted MFS family arabinose efflux permease
MPATLSQLRDFRLLWASGLLAGLGAQMSALALPLLVLRQTGSPVQAGTVGTVSLGMLLLTMLPGGILADTVERRRLMRLCDVGSLLAVTALTVAVLGGTAPLPLVLLVVGAGAVLNSLYLPAAFGLLRAVVPAELVGLASSRMQARGAAARLVGPLVGGLLFGLHPAAPFIAEGIALLLSTLCLALMRTASRPDRTPGTSMGWQELGAGLTFLWHRPYVRTTLLVFGLGMNVAFSAMIFAALAIASDGGHSGLGGGIILSLAAAGSLAGALLAPKLRPDERPRTVMVATCWSFAATVAVLTVSRQPLVMGLLTGACMVLGAVSSIGLLTVLLVATPKGLTGRVQSAASLISSLAQPLGPVAAGAMLSAWGATATFGALTGVFGVCAVIITWAPSTRRPVTAVDRPVDQAVDSSEPMHSTANSATADGSS